jgi:hypothetical protein
LLGGHWPSITPGEHSRGMSSRRAIGSRFTDPLARRSLAQHHARGTLRWDVFPSFDRFIDPLARRSLAQHHARGTLRWDVFPSFDRFIDPLVRRSLVQDHAGRRSSGMSSLRSIGSLTLLSGGHWPSIAPGQHSSGMSSLRPTGSLTPLPRGHWPGSLISRSSSP